MRWESLLSVSLQATPRRWLLRSLPGWLWLGGSRPAALRMSLLQVQSIDTGRNVPWQGIVQKPCQSYSELSERAVISDQIQRRRCLTHGAEKARDLSAVMGAVIHQMQKNLPHRLRIRTTLHVLVRD